MSATTMVVRTEARLFLREPGSLFWILVFPTALVGILGAIPSFREPDPALDGQRVLDLYAPISVLLAVTMAALSSMPPVIAGYREAGILRRLSTTPVHPASLLLAQAAVHAAAVVASLFLVLGFGRAVFDIRLPGSVAWYAGCVALACAALFAVGTVVAAVGRTARVVQTISTATLFPMMFTSGLWLPVQAMPAVLRDIVVATPLGAAAEALHAAQDGLAPDPLHLAVLTGWATVLGLLAARCFRWD